MWSLLIVSGGQTSPLRWRINWLVTFYPRERAWFTTVPAFGEWWAARDSLTVAVEETSSTTRTLVLEIDGVIDGLALRLPASWQLAEQSDQFNLSRSVLLLTRLEGRTEIALQVAP